MNFLRNYLINIFIYLSFLNFKQKIAFDLVRALICVGVNYHGIFIMLDKNYCLVYRDVLVAENTHHDIIINWKRLLIKENKIKKSSLTYKQVLSIWKKSILFICCNSISK